MFILAEGQIRPKHDFSIVIKKGSHDFASINQRVRAFQHYLQNQLNGLNFDTVKEFAKYQFVAKNRYEKSMDYVINQNSINQKWDSNYSIFVNFVKHKRKKVVKDNKLVNNEKEGIIAYFYFINKNLIETASQNNNNFTVKFKKNAIISHTPTFSKPENVIFEVSNGKESFFVQTNKEAEHLRDKGYKVTPVKYVESNGVIFEIVRAIKSVDIRKVDLYENKIKIYKTQKNAALDGRPVFAITMNGISGKNYFTKDFNTVNEGFYKVYGEVEGYVLVETVVSILNGKQRIVTFIKKNDKETINKITSKIKVIEE
jgi:hypothetical protein